MASNSFSITLRGKVPRPMHKFSFYLTPKESLEFKVSGFGSDGQHLQLVASLPGLVSIKQSARPKQLEQGVTITAINTGTVAIHARESTAKSGRYLNNCAPVNDRFGGGLPYFNDQYHRYSRNARKSESRAEGNVDGIIG